MEAPNIKEKYSEIDFESLGFHDCYVYSIRWVSDTFSVTFDLDYIVEWIEPDKPRENYHFWICKAELRFENIAQMKIALDWDESMPECQIQKIHRKENRTTPNGELEWQWELELIKPDGMITLWATGFELRLIEPPILSDVQCLGRAQD